MSFSSLSSWILALALVSACNGHLDFQAGTGLRADAGDASGGCRADSDCRAAAGVAGVAALHCDNGQGAGCVECTADTHCARAGARRCETTLRRCVACLGNGDCATGQICLANRCLWSCGAAGAAACPTGTSCEDGICASCEADDAQKCALSGTGSFCLASAPVCVACRTDGDCGGASAHCDVVRKTCVACASGQDCPASAPLCDPTTGTCVPRA